MAVRMLAFAAWKARCVCVVALFGVAACSGGEDATGSAAAPPPSTASTNNAPSAVASVDNPSPDEGQPFVVDAMTSSDADGDALTFMWTQTAGQPLEIEDPTAPTLELTVPELTATETATFELQVSDGELVDTDSIDVVLTNIDLSPDEPRFGNNSSTLAVSGTNPTVLFGVNDFGFGPIVGETVAGGSTRLFSVELDAAGNLVEGGRFEVIPTFLPPLRVEPASFLPFISVGGFVNFTILQEELGVVSFLTDIQSASSTFDDRLDIVSSVEVSGACSIVSLGSGFVVIGQRSGGLTQAKFSNTGDVFEVEIEVSLEKLDTTDRPICVLSNVSNPISANPGGAAFFNGPEIGFDDLIALDETTNEIVLFQYSLSGYVEADSVPADLGTDSRLELVASKRFPAGLLLAFSDGVHDGEHVFVLVGLDPDRNIIQRSIPIPLGVPSAVDFTARGFVVATSTSPEAVFINLSNPSFFPRFDDFFALDSPTFGQIGLGVGSAAALSGVNGIGTLVAVPASNEIRSFDIVDVP